MLRIYLKMAWQETHSYHLSERNDWHGHRENLELPQVQLPDVLTVVSGLFLVKKNCPASIMSVLNLVLF